MPHKLQLFSSLIEEQCSFQSSNSWKSYKLRRPLSENLAPTFSFQFCFPAQPLTRLEIRLLCGRRPGWWAREGRCFRSVLLRYLWDELEGQEHEDNEDAERANKRDQRLPQRVLIQGVHLQRGAAVTHALVMNGPLTGEREGLDDQNTQALETPSNVGNHRQPPQHCWKETSERRVSTSGQLNLIGATCICSLL